MNIRKYDSQTFMFAKRSKTFAANKKPRSSRKPNSPKKTVRFNEQNNIDYPPSIRAEEPTEKNSLVEVSRWYTRDDFEHFKENFMREAEDFVLASRQCNSSDDDIGNACSSYRRRLRRTFDLCSRRDFDMETKLEEGFSDRTSRELSIALTGLERLASREIVQDRIQRRNELSQAICVIQESNLGMRKRPDLIRRASERITLPSRLFAERLGHMQRAAAL